MVRLGIVGCGNFGRDVHFAALLALRQAGIDFEVSLLCDCNEDHLALGKAIWPHAHPCRSVCQMLDGEWPDGVMVLTPPQVTAETGSLFLAHGIPCLLEKPPGNSVAEVLHLRQNATAGRTFAAVGFNRRHCTVLKMAQHFREETGEALERIDCRFRRAARVDEDFSTTLIHAVDALAFLAGRPPEEMRMEYQDIPHAVNISVHVGYGTLVGEIDCRPACGVNQECYTLETAHYRIVADFPCQPGSMEEIAVWRGEKLVRKWSMSPQHPLREKFYFQAGYYTEDEAFLNRLAGHGIRPQEEPLEAAVYSVAAMEAFRQRKNCLKFNSNFQKSRMQE